MQIRNLTMLVVVGGLVLAPPGSVSAQQDQEVPVEATRIVPEPVSVTVTAAAEMTADESVILRPQIDGRVVSIPFVEGTRVEKGEVLFELDDGLLAAQHAEAVAALDLARQNRQRARMLFSTGAGTERVRDEAEAQERIAEARLVVARERLGYTKIRAPFSGIAGFRKISVGAYVKAGDDLVEVVAVDPMNVSFDIPERYLRAVAVGQKVEVAVDALAGEVFGGRLTTIAPRVTAAGRSLRLRAEVDNPDGRLRPGLFARASLRIAERAEALLIPESSIVPQGDKRLIYKIVDGRAQLTPVELGIRRAGKVEVIGGVVEGDIVVSAGQIKLRDGAGVIIVGGDAIGGVAPVSEQAPNLGSGS